MGHINLDYDENLDEDAGSFGISIATEPAARTAHPPEVQAPDPIPAPHHDPIVEAHALGLNDAIVLAMEVCSWEYTFYAWCDEYLFGVRPEAMLDIPVVRDALRRVRNYWGPMYFSTGVGRARVRYFAIMAAQAAVSAAERRNKQPLIQKILYYTSAIEKGAF